MTERDASGGGMSGATGDLTPDQIQDDLIPAERREIEDSAHKAQVTRAQAGSPADEDEEPAAPPEPAAKAAPQSEPRSGGDEVASEEERY